MTADRFLPPGQMRNRDAHLPNSIDKKSPADDLFPPETNFLQTLVRQTETQAGNSANALAKFLRSIPFQLLPTLFPQTFAYQTEIHAQNRRRELKARQTVKRLHNQSPVDRLSHSPRNFFHPKFSSDFDTQNRHGNSKPSKTSTPRIH